MARSRAQTIPPSEPGEGLQMRSGAEIFLQAMIEGKVQLAHFILVALGEAAVNASVESRGTGGRTLLMCAAELPQPTERTCFLQLLLGRGAEVERRDSAGRTALSLASELGHLDAVRLLVLHGADPAGSDDEGKSPLTYAVQGSHSSVVRCLQRELKKRGGPTRTATRVKEEEGFGVGHGNVCKEKQSISPDGLARHLTNDQTGSSSRYIRNLFWKDTVNHVLLMDNVIANPHALEKEEEKCKEIAPKESSYFHQKFSALSTRQHVVPEQLIQNPLIFSSKYSSHLPSLHEHSSEAHQMPLGSKKTRKDNILSSWLRRGPLCDSPPSQVKNGSVPRTSGSFWKWMTPRLPLNSAGTIQDAHTPFPNITTNCGQTFGDTVLENHCFLEDTSIAGRSTVEFWRREYGTQPVVTLQHQKDNSKGLASTRCLGETDEEDLFRMSHERHSCPGARLRVFGAFRRHTSPDLRFSSKGNSDTDMEKLMQMHE